MVKPFRSAGLPEGQLIDVDGRPVFILSPETFRSPTRPWVWYAPTLLPQYPDHHMAWLFGRFLAEGFAVVGVDVGESYGSPAGTAAFSRAYRLLTQEHGFSPRPVLLPRSRGGLMLYNWAARNPSGVACIAGIYPVCDLRSYPGLDKASQAYGMSADELASALDQFNPLDLLAPLAAWGVPILHIHGDKDKIVPLDENSGALIERYRALGGPGHLIVACGHGHSPWDGFFRSEGLVQFVLRHADERNR